MGFVVLPALIPDIAAVYSVYFAAFASDAITAALFAGTPKEEWGDEGSEFRKSHTRNILHYWQTSTTQYTLKCVDTTTNKIVGMGLLDVWPTPSDWKRGGITWLEGSARSRAEALVDPLWAAREKMWDNERYIYCHVVAVHPDYQRQGIGKLITEYGLRVAEQAGLPVYLEASTMGTGLYEKLGFRRVREKLVHKGEDVEVPLMVWVPQGKEVRLPEAVQFAEKERSSIL
ncbi:acyl-CoA N-acyltransferase [Massarina eburnea CBS 473.64]|uniref:Acyl-CoA N-acyltransferase n=1 Tax=Massarina eburnea CBS 473.64 TaxID=1395130 RepID=A0A6A6RIP1_9PLEO|nr:acyl-CoA N-acyltransferase [Massarina eburnea CBS 473.64]